MSTKIGVSSVSHERRELAVILGMQGLCWSMQADAMLTVNRPCRMTVLRKLGGGVRDIVVEDVIMRVCLFASWFNNCMRLLRLTCPCQWVMQRNECVGSHCHKCHVEVHGGACRCQYVHGPRHRSERGSGPRWCSHDDASVLLKHVPLTDRFEEHDSMWVFPTISSLNWKLRGVATVYSVCQDEHWWHCGITMERRRSGTKMVQDSRRSTSSRALQKLSVFGHACGENRENNSSQFWDMSDLRSLTFRRQQGITGSFFFLPHACSARRSVNLAFSVHDIASRATHQLRVVGSIWHSPAVRMETPFRSLDERARCLTVGLSRTFMGSLGLRGVFRTRNPVFRYSCGTHWVVPTSFPLCSSHPPPLAPSLVRLSRVLREPILVVPFDSVQDSLSQEWLLTLLSTGILRVLNRPQFPQNQTISTHKSYSAQWCDHVHFHSNHWLHGDCDMVRRNDNSVIRSFPYHENTNCIPQTQSGLSVCIGFNGTLCYRRSLQRMKAVIEICFDIWHGCVSSSAIC